MLGWAIKQGLREAPNPCRDVKHFRGRKIERFLSAMEMTKLGDALSATVLQEPNAVAAIRLLVFTGARLGKLLGHRHASTTARYAHLSADPLRAANEKIGATIAAAISSKSAAG
jgi:site-specific recombinase XerD